MISRAAPQVLRLAGIYALFDLSSVIKKDHLNAALAIWQYCEDSCRFIFGNCTGDAVADEILSLLSKSNNGLTRSQIRNSFGRNKSGDKIKAALKTLLLAGLAASLKESGDAGRPAERWVITKGSRTT
jgi:hypothetical protein